MNDKFFELFEYTFHFNAEVIDAFQTNVDKLPARVEKLISHTLSAQQVWNTRILGLPSMEPWQMHPIEELHPLNRKNYEQTLSILRDFDLSKTITYQNTKGQKFENKIEDILFHVINHSTYHRGQIALLFRESGIDPLTTDYIFFKR